MDYLFSLKPNQTFSEGIRSLSKFQISGMSYNSIVERGYNYFRDGSVYPNVEIQTGKCELEVSGNYGEYQVAIFQQGDKIYGSCDCPYDDATCKHLIASLLHLRNRVPVHKLQEADITEAIIAKAARAKNDFEKYVNNLPVEQLRKLVLEFAPDYFRKEVTVKKTANAGKKQQLEKAFRNAAISINSLFDGDLYDINGFAQKTDKALAKLRPFWTTLPHKVTDELMNFIQNVDEAFEEGNLYDNHGDYSYEGEEVVTYIAEFIAALPNAQRKSAIEIILEAKEGQNYGCFDGLALEIIHKIPANDWSSFTKIVLEMAYFNYLNGREGLELYDYIKPYLSDNQKKNILTEQDNTHFKLALAKYYESKFEYTKAYDVLENSLNKAQPTFYRFLRNQNNPQDEQFQMMIRLCNEKLGGENTMFWIEKYLEELPSIESFQTAVEYRPNERIVFENHFQNHHTLIFAGILEAENRLGQVVQLFKDYEYEFRNGKAIYQFFQRHKTLFPDDATIVFKKELEIFLKEAKQRHYEKVAEILEELQPILPTDEFKILVLDIKTKYYRRTSLMRILRGKGW